MNGIVGSRMSLSHPGKRSRQGPSRRPVTDQVAASVVDASNKARIAAEVAKLAAQEEAMGQAVAEVQNIIEFIGTPSEILGSIDTKHGEIAEVMQVGVTRARDVLVQVAPSATDASHRMAPEDYFMNGTPVQSKFINGANKTLDHVISHMDKYPDFGRDGSFYHVPRDQYERLARIRAGDTEGVNARSVKAALKKIEEIERLSGKPFEEVVQPSISTYQEVQLGNAHESIEGHLEDLHSENEKLEQVIRDDHKPSFAGGLKAAGTAVVVSGTLTFGVKVAGKYFKDGKNVFRGEFSEEDWNEVGLDTAKGAVTGGVTGAAVYAMTNCAGMSAPVAGAFVSAAAGVASLGKRHQEGKLSVDGLVDDSLLICTDVAVVAMFSAAGQAVIPIPILGALIGSFAGKAAFDLLGDYSAAAQAQVEARLEANRAALTKAHQRQLDALKAKFLPVQSMTAFAFDLDCNAGLLESSIALARIHKVPKQLILKNEQDVLAFLGGDDFS